MIYFDFKHGVWKSHVANIVTMLCSTNGGLKQIYLLFFLWQRTKKKQKTMIFSKTLTIAKTTY